MKTLTEAEMKCRKGRDDKRWWYVGRTRCFFYIEVPESHMVYAMSVPTYRIRKALAQMDKELNVTRKPRT